MMIRQGNLQDLPAIQHLFKETVLTVNAKDYSAEQVSVWASSVEDFERWQNFFETEEFYLAFDENKLVGFASLKGIDYFEKLFVHKDHQSKGIAKQLVDVIEARAKEKGAKFIHSDVSITAIPFFKSNHYKVIKTQQKNFKGTLFENHIIVKALV